MKKLFILILLLCGHLFARTQQFDPQMLILSPGNVTYDPAFKTEIGAKDAEIRKAAARGMRPAEETQPANIQLMQKSLAAYLKNINFFKTASFYSQSYLTYRFYEKLPNCLILLKDTTTGDKLEDLQRIAVNTDMPLLLNFSQMTFYLQKGQKFCKISVQLYDKRVGGFLINREYKGDWNNPGFEFACEQNSLGCTINNALSQALNDVVRAVAENSPTLQKEQNLAVQRANVIASINRQPFDATLIRQVIPRDSISIDLNNLYRCFYNDDHTKFVGFFIKWSNKKGSLLTDKDDKNVKIISSKDIHDKGYLDQSPGFYAYLVRGINFNGKWYFEKSDVTYFDAENIEEGKLNYLNNLQDWTFFAENTAAPTPAFWEGLLFKKIEDKRKDPNWEKYKDMWASEERENRDYVGMYELVADKLKAEKTTEEHDFRKKILSTQLLPVYKEQIRLHANRFKNLKDTTVLYNLIYPKDRHVVLNPMTVIDENGDKYIRFFVLLPQTSEVFEWTLVKPYPLKKGEYTNDPITNTIRAFTDWNYSYDNLDDDKFWNEKVLAKGENGYKYLIKLK